MILLKDRSVSLIAIAVFCSLLPWCSVQAEESADRLRPRVEGNIRGGSERSIGMGEFWVPLSQGPDRVLYGDVRYSHDDGDNGEGNLGVGYRKIMTNPFTGGGPVIMGGSAWIDRRRTDMGTTFHQGVIGGEMLAEDYDIRLNAYMPFEREEKHATPNIGRASPYLAGTGILYDTNGVLVEEAHPGLDMEIGYRVPVFEDDIDAIRVYGGGYHFDGDKSDNVSGWRTRIAADITEDIQIGARFQRDDVRGSQSFLEATVRFPFGNKKSFRDHGLRARLDESPERDIDIVTATKQVDTGVGKAALNSTSGDQQRVLHVDNTAAAGGDGSLEKPFNTLKAAEAALAAHDVVYIHRGDGTTTGQDQGLVISHSGVSVIGSGSDFVFDNGKFTAEKSFSGIVLAQKTTAPVITNTHIATDVNDALYNGVGIVTAQPVDSIFVSGIDVRDTGGMGIRLQLNSGIASVSNVNVTNTTYDGIHLHTAGTSISDLIELKDSKVSGMTASGRYGVVSYATTDAYLGAIKFSNLELENNYINFRIYSNINASVGSVELNNVVANNALGSADGQIYAAANSTIDTVQLNKVITNGTSPNGLHIYSATQAKINKVYLSGVESKNHASSGLLISASVDSSIAHAEVKNSTFTGNRYGAYLDDNSTSSMNVVLSGGNSLFGNTTADLRLDLDGETVNAQYNWWGQAGGPVAGRIINEGACPNCGTADTSNALSSAP